MKKVFFRTAVLFLMPLCVFGAKRIVLGQLFTSTTCPPCVAANASLTDVISQRDSTLAVVRFHANWPSPGNDPYYWYNVAANSTRINMYSINAVPTFVLDGTQSVITTGAVDTKAAVPTTLALALYRQFPASALAANQGAGKVMVELYNEESTTRTFVLNGALTESEIHYTGTNGDPVHHQAMIDMLPNYYSGEVITLEGKERKILTYDFNVYDTITFPSITDPHLVDAGTCELVFWCQNATGMEIYQAAKVKVIDADTSGPGLTITDIKVYDQTGDGKLIANEKAEVKVTLKNNSGSPKENVHVFLEITDNNVTVLDGFAEIPLIEANESFEVDSTKGDGLLIKAGSGYKDEKFDMTCKAGSEDGSWAVTVMPLGVIEDPKPVFGFSLSAALGAYSNTAILTLSEPADVKLLLYDASGRMQRTLYSGGLNAGTQRLSFSYEGLAEGVYFIKASAGSMSKVEKLVIVK